VKLNRQSQALLGPGAVGGAAGEADRPRRGTRIEQAGGRARKGWFRLVHRTWICRGSQVRQIIQVIERGAGEALAGSFEGHRRRLGWRGEGLRPFGRPEVALGHRRNRDRRREHRQSPARVTLAAPAGDRPGAARQPRGEVARA
jgi:hypothetical protein